MLSYLVSNGFDFSFYSYYTNLLKVAMVSLSLNLEGTENETHSSAFFSLISFLSPISRWSNNSRNALCTSISIGTSLSLSGVQKFPFSQQQKNEWWFWCDETP